MTLLPLLYLGRAGEAEAARAHTARLSGLNDDILLIHSGGIFGATRALILAHLDRHGEAREIIGRVLARLGIGRREEETPAWTLAYLLEAATRTRDREAAAVLAARLAPLTSVVSSNGTSTCTARHLGAAAALLGNRAEARGYYEQALQVAGRVRFRPEIALTHLQLAELLHDGDPDERRQARRHLAIAISELQEMTMQPALEHALRLAERDASVHRDVAVRPGGLTTREVEVLQLVAQGKTNREIAAATVLSVLTVQNHLVAIYRKIDARNRADATAYAFRHGLARPPAP
jgi:DNA-binding CsgD family transcriptional regulator